MVKTTSARKFCIWNISNFMGIQPKLHILKKEACNVRLGKKEEIIYCEDRLNKIVFLYRKIFRMRINF